MRRFSNSIYGGIHLKNNTVKSKTAKTQNGKRLLVLIIVIASFFAVAIAATVAVVGYFTSPAYTATRIMQAIDNKDGAALEELIAPDEREYVNSVLSPLDMKIADLAESLSDTIDTLEVGDCKINSLVDGDKAKYTVTLPESLGGSSVSIDFKRINGVWYLSPTGFIKSLPIKTAVKLVASVKDTDGKAFMDCIHPGERGTIKLFGAIIGVTEANIVETFLKLTKMEGESLEGYKPDSLKSEGAEVTVKLSGSDGKSISLLFKNYEGEWYISTSKIFSDLFNLAK